MDPGRRGAENHRNDELLVVLHAITNTCVNLFAMINLFHMRRRLIMSSRSQNEFRKRYSLLKKLPKRIGYLNGVINLSDEASLIHLRMTRSAFARLLFLLESSGGLKATRNSSTTEQVVQFLTILSHHTKNRMVKDNYNRSTRTISKHFHNVLTAVMKIHHILLVRPVPVDETCTNGRWSPFKGCLGALDGTYVPVSVAKVDSGRYRNRKGHIAVNILGVCDSNINFIYILSGWEGSAADSRVLRDAVTRRNGLKIPRGNYYLCDNGYTNGEGFLTPYRGVRYHLDEWASGNYRPQNKEEYFNMKHCRARNVIERAFGVLKKRWGILRSCSFYPIRVQNRIIMACCLLHNFVRLNMPFDPVEQELQQNFTNEEVDDNYVDVVESSPEWIAWRDNMAAEMYNEWRH